jgi:MerR family transcriptional regulator/heat shock protein HspR
MPPRAKSKAKTGKRKRKKSRAGYMISAVAELYAVHPQTLRLYERLGLLKPSRTQGNTRVYTDQDIERLETILTLSRDLGVNLAGIEVVLNMRDKMVEMERQVQSFVDFVREEMARGLAAPQDARLRNAIVRFRPTKVARIER